MLCVLTTHPIQYQVPLWKKLGEVLGDQFEVWFLTRHGVNPSYQAEFGLHIRWDIDLLGGYRHRFLSDSTKAPERFLDCRLHPGFGQDLRKAGVTVLWIQGWQVAGYWQAAWSARKAGMEVWLKGESNDLFQRTEFKNQLRQYALSRLFKKVSSFFSIGSANRRLYEKFGINPDQIRSTPYCVDNVFFRDRAAELRSARLDIREGWGIPEGSCCLLFCGKFVSKKRPFDLIAAAEILRKKTGSPIHLLFVGDGPLGGEMRSLCQVSWDVTSKGPLEGQDTQKPAASFVGFLNQSEIPRAYVAADVLVLCSDHGETWGLVVNEAMVCGLPPVVSDACGSAEDLASPLDARLVYPCGDTEALAKSILWLLDNPIPNEKIVSLVSAHDLSITLQSITSTWSLTLRNRTPNTGHPTPS